MQNRRKYLKDERKIYKFVPLSEKEKFNEAWKKVHKGSAWDRIKRFGKTLWDGLVYNLLGKG